MASPFEKLLGEWTTESVSDGKVVATGHSTFTLDGGLVRQASTTQVADDAPQVWHDNAPRSATAVFGGDGDDGPLTMLYADSRGVQRIYHSSIERDTWTIWRESPGFNQRYVGTISADGDTIPGRHERSEDGETWELDFDFTYTRAPAPPGA